MQCLGIDPPITLPDAQSERLLRCAVFAKRLELVAVRPLFFSPNFLAVNLFYSLQKPQRAIAAYKFLSLSDKAF